MKCKAVASAIKLLNQNGWQIKEEVTGWSAVDLVVYLDKKLTENMRSQLKNIDCFSYHRVDKDPHYAKEEVFICNKCKEAIAFPMS
jgi:hypothetical protein